MTTQTITTAGFMTEPQASPVPDPDQPIAQTIEVNFNQRDGFEFSQDYKLKSAFPVPEPPTETPERGEFWCVWETKTARIYGPYMTETAALSLIQEEGIEGTISRMTLK